MEFVLFGTSFKVYHKIVLCTLIFYCSDLKNERDYVETTKLVERKASVKFDYDIECINFRLFLYAL